jgi:hypothetical protein
LLNPSGAARAQAEGWSAISVDTCLDGCVMSGV